MVSLPAGSIQHWLAASAPNIGATPTRSLSRLGRPKTSSRRQHSRHRLLSASALNPTVLANHCRSGQRHSGPLQATCRRSARSTEWQLSAQQLTLVSPSITFSDPRRLSKRRGSIVDRAYLSKASQIQLAPPECPPAQPENGSGRSEGANWLTLREKETRRRLTKVPIRLTMPTEVAHAS